MLSDRLMQKEPHGEECKHLKEHSMVDRPLNFTVIIKMVAFSRFQWLSWSTLKVEVTESSVTQTTHVCRRDCDFVVDGIPADDGTQVTDSQMCLIHCHNHYRVKNILSIYLPVHNNTCFGTSKTTYFPFHSFVSVYNLYSK